jgi:hypothetical protein
MEIDCDLEHRKQTGIEILAQKKSDYGNRVGFEK